MYSSDLKKNSDVKKSKQLTDLLNNSSDFAHRDLYVGMVEYMKSYLTQDLVDRDSYYLMLSKYRDNWIVNGIYDILLNDIFVDNGSTDFIRINIEKGKGKFQKEAERLFRKLNLPELLQSLTPDLLHYGSYPLKIVAKPGVGVVALIDDVEPSHVISINDSSNRPLFYFVDEAVHDPRTNALAFTTTEHEFKYYDITQILYFSLNVNFIKLPLPTAVTKAMRNEIDYNRDSVRTVLKMYYDLDSHGKKRVVAKQKQVILDNPVTDHDIEDELDEEYNSLIPDTLKVRTSTSFLYGVLDKIKDSILLNKVSVYNNLATLFAPKLVGIPVPDEYDPSQVIEIVQKYNTLLNSDLGRLTFSDNFNNINLSEVAKTKCVPIVGDRSNPTQIDYGADRNTATDLDKIRDNLKETLNSIGIPAELFNGESDAKTNIKTNVRYAKKVKKIQKNICRALKGLLLLHFGLKYPDEVLYETDIDIQLKNNVNIDELENMEAQDLVISATNSILSLMSSIAELNESNGQDNPSDYTIDYSEIVKSVKQMLETVGSPFASCMKKIKNVDPDDKFITPLDPERIEVTRYSTGGRGAGYSGDDSSGENDSQLEITAEEPSSQETTENDQS